MKASGTGGVANIVQQPQMMQMIPYRPQQMQQMHMVPYQLMPQQYQVMTDANQQALTTQMVMPQQTQQQMAMVPHAAQYVSNQSAPITTPPPTSKTLKSLMFMAMDDEPGFFGSAVDSIPATIFRHNRQRFIIEWHSA
jgi:hypothetical protein